MQGTVYMQGETAETRLAVSESNPEHDIPGHAAIILLEEVLDILPRVSHGPVNEHPDRVG